MKNFILTAISVVALAVIVSCGKESGALEVSEPEGSVEQVPVMQKGSDPIDEYYRTWNHIVGRILSHINPHELGLILNADFPEIGPLSKLEIYDVSGRRLRFADLPEGERLDFIRNFALTMAREQHRKAEIARDVPELFSFMNEIMTVCRNIVDRLMDSGAGIAAVIDAFASSRGYADFFGNSISGCKSGNGVELPVMIGPLRPEFFSFETLKAQMAGVGKKGMIMVQLPIHGYPNTLMNISNYLLPEEEREYIHRGIGHTCILTEDFLPTTTEDDSIIYGVDLAGAKYESLKYWCSPFYMMELKRLKFIWAPELDGDNPLTMEKVAIPETEIDDFVADELSFIGAPFIEQSPINYLFSKYRIPEHGFTCVGLVWYSAKRILGIDISIPAVPTVFPVNAVCSPYTDIVAVIQE